MWWELWWWVLGLLQAHEHLLLELDLLDREPHDGLVLLDLRESVLLLFDLQQQEPDLQFYR